LASGQAIVEGEVRELVRRRGIDPVAEPEVVGRLVQEVVSEYLDRAVNSTLPSLGDVEALARALLDSVAGFGPLQPYLDDPSIDDYRTVKP
jgi:pilus assembly protein CpaF